MFMVLKKATWTWRFSLARYGTKITPWSPTGDNTLTGNNTKHLMKKHLTISKQNQSSGTSIKIKTNFEDFKNCIEFLYRIFLDS